MYKLDKFGGIIRTIDGASIPADPNNLDYAEFLIWQAAGNTPLPYEPPPVDLKAAAQAELTATDGDMARIAEDLIGALIAKGVIAEDDLPQPARDKLARRSELRSKLA